MLNLSILLDNWIKLNDIVGCSRQLFNTGDFVDYAFQIYIVYRFVIYWVVESIKYYLEYINN